MALGGGTFTFQTKGLPGTYINFVSASAASGTYGERGIAAMALPLPWGPVDEIMTVTVEDLVRRSLQLFGRAYSHPDLAGLRELFAGARMAYLFRLGGGGQTASCALGTARYPGSLGNEITLVVTQGATGYGVETLLEGVRVDEQTVTGAAELIDNDFVLFDPSATLSVTAGMSMTGGSDGTPTMDEYSRFLDLSESYRFNALGCLSTEEEIRRLFAQHTRRMRDEVGIKFQCVLHRYTGADHEGVISVENEAAETAGGLVYWVTGITAGCAINRSNTNKKYTGELTVDTDYTQSELVGLLERGSFVLHRVGGDVHVLEDINTLVTLTADKSADFALNQTIRVIDQIATDIAGLFATRYLGIVPNDRAGRLSLWSDIVSHHRQLETLRAIDDFQPDSVVVEPGETKRSVFVFDCITPVCAMSQLYMTVLVQ